MSKTIDLSIVIPALREEGRIGKTLTELAIFLENNMILNQLKTEVVIVAAKGGDKTVDIAKSYSSKLSNLSILQPGSPVGKGRDVREGVLKSTGKKVVFMDADLATPLEYLTLLLQEIEAGFDVAIGTRNLRKHHKKVLRRAISNVGNLAFRLMGGVWVEDSQCGFKMFTREAADICFSRLTILRWGFDMEVLSIAKQNRLSISTVRINDWHHVEGGSFDGSVFVNSLQTLSDLKIILLNRITRRYTR